MQFSTAILASASYTGQALLMLGFALLLFYYYRQYKRSYLRFWSYASFYYALGCGANVARLLATDTNTVSSNIAHILSHTHLAAFYLALSLLLIGVADVAKGKLPKRPVRWLIYSLAVALSIVPWFISEPALTSEITSGNDSLMFSVTGISLVIAGAVIWYFSNHSLGPKLISFAFMGQGTKNIGVVYILANEQLFNFHEITWAMQGFLNFIFLSITALGVTIWLLETERHHALNAMQQADFLGRHDALTKLPNREELITKLPLFIDSCRANDRHLAIVMVGVDRFKAINDTLGMRGGDRVLIELSERLKTLPQRQLFQARISGDVFVLIFDHLKRLSMIEDLCWKIHQQLQEPMLIDGREVSVSCSLGIARYPQHGSRAENLLSKANIALANAKFANNPAVMSYQRGMDENYIRLADMEPELRRSLQKDELFIQLQPIYKGRRQNLTAFEALVRWQHPERGLLGPGEFLPFMEQLGMMTELDAWVLERCAKLIYEWRKAGERPVPIAVNLGARQFQSNQLAQHMRNLMQKYELKAADLELEMTENVAVTDMTTGSNVLSELQAMGIRVAIDDFGTGYSSLAYLRRLPIDRIKIDRSFVSEMLTSDANTTIVRTLIQLSHGLKKQVIAEGVETHEQLATLLDMGCDAAQGYLLSPPVDIARALELLREHWQNWGKVHFQLVSDT
ncbi:MAG: diguanylate cyclase/phosphodiesterase [Idiomarinaceae bacterium HL-53]|nr:MAG: diguanylate cyclase/phosphodiesterase [Idiomarinaceae bacterium HL-53]CUS47940.1 diguanylate cyclase/phosphodiesterase [Idiomarinaceae bacterium HL-53]